MVTPLQWVLVGIGAYWALVVWLRRNGLLPPYVGTQGPILTLHTRRFRDLLDRIASRKRAWRAWGSFGVGVALVVMAGTFAFLVFGALSTLRDPGPVTAVNRPRNVLVIPGVNEFLPLSVAPEIVLGLAVGLVVHEGGHGVMCRVGDIDIESLGLAFVGPIPMGAFVEPDEDSRRAANRGAQTRMFAAGVTNNFAVTALAFALLFGPVVGSIAVADGAAVGGALPGSAAATAGIDTGDRIVAVEGRAIGSNEDLERTLAEVDAATVSVRVDDGDRVRTVPVNRSLLVTGVTGNTPFAGAIAVDPGDPTRIAAVNGTPVETEAGLTDALRTREVATLRTGDGTTATGPVGAAVRFQPGGPAADAGFPARGDAVVVRVAGERVVSATELGDALDDTNPGQRVRIEAYVREDGAWVRRNRTVELGTDERDGSGFLGVGVAPGISGLTVSDFGTRLYPAGGYLRLLGGDGATTSFLQQVISVLLLPFASVAAGLPFNFAGFTGGIANFYAVEGALAPFRGAVFFLANALFWTGWINLNLGVFNCIPAFPLDGGHILRTSTESVVARLPVEGRRRLTTAVTTSIGLTMLASLLVALFGPQFL